MGRALEYDAKVNNRDSIGKKKNCIIQGRSMQVISGGGCPQSWQSVPEEELQSQQQFSDINSSQ